MSKDEAGNVRKLGDFGKLRLQEKTYKMTDVQGIPLVITDFSLEDGRFGEFAWITATKPDGERIKVRCGGSFVIEALKEAQSANALPVEATFVLRGNAWVVD